MYPVQIVNRKRPRPISYVRLAPHTIFHPTPNQIRARIEFGKLAKKYKGLKGFDPKTGLPIVAAKIAKEFRGKRFGRKVKIPKWMSKLEDEKYLREFLLKKKIARAIALIKSEALV